MAKFVEKSKEIEAILWDGNLSTLKEISGMFKNMTIVAAMLDGKFTYLTHDNQTVVQIGQYVFKMNDSLCAMNKDAFEQGFNPIA